MQRIIPKLRSLLSSKISPREYLNAVQRGNMMMINKYIAENANHTESALSVLNEDRMNAVQIAVVYNRKEVVKLLAEKHPRFAINFGGYFHGIYPLHYTTDRGDIDLVKLLLQFDKIDLHYSDNRGRTAYAIAVGKELHDIVRLFDEYDWQRITNLEDTLSESSESESLESDTSSLYSSYKSANNDAHKPQLNILQDKLDKSGYNGSIPPEIICPISQMIFDRPIKVSSGITYDHNNLLRYFDTKKSDVIRCPMTNKEIKRIELDKEIDSSAMLAVESFLQNVLPTKSPGKLRFFDCENNEILSVKDPGFHMPAACSSRLHKP